MVSPKTDMMDNIAVTGAGDAVLEGEPDNWPTPAPFSPRAIKRAAIYARVSSLIQEKEGTSLISQVVDCKAYCMQHGYSVDENHIYREVHTGSEYRERKELSRMRDAIRRREIDVVVAIAVDRLTRNQAHLFVLVDEAEHAGVEIELVLEKLDDTAEGKLIRSVLGFVGELEREKIIERSQRGRIARAQAGKLIPSRKPLYGYQFNADRTAYCIHPEESLVVKRIFQLALDGVTLREITRQLNNDHIPSPGGKRWGHHAILRIIKDRQYTGEAVAFRFQAVKEAGTRRIKRRPEEDYIKLPDGTVPQLVDLVSFERIQEQVRRNQELATRNNQHPELALLRGGYAKCGYCEHNLVVRLAYGKDRHSPYYQCGQGYRVDTTCERHTIIVSILDEAVWHRIVEVVKNPQTILTKIGELKGENPLAVEITALERALTKLRREQKNLLSHLASLDPAYAETVTLRLNELASKQRRLEQEQVSLQALHEDWKATQRELEKFEQWCLNFAKGLGTHTYEERRRACQMLGVQVRVWSRTHTPRFEITMSPDIIVWHTG